MTGGKTFFYLHEFCFLHFYAKLKSQELSLIMCVCVCVCVYSDLRGNCLLESIHGSVPLTLIENVGIRIRKLKPKKHISKAIGV